MADKQIILKELKSLLQQHFQGDIRNIILFGSQAAGTAREDSDYDVLIVLNNRRDWRYKKAIRYICYDIALKFDIFFDVKIISLDELHDSKQGNPFLFANALKYGVTV